MVSSEENPSASSSIALTLSQKRRLNEALEQYRTGLSESNKKPSKAVLTSEERKAKYHAALVKGMKKDALVAEENRRVIIAKNIENWKEKADPRWHDASLDHETMFPEVRICLEDRLRRWETGTGTDQTSILFAGLFGRGKTWSAYAYPFELIKRGLLDNSQIFAVTEASLSVVAGSGFQKGEGLGKILSPQHKFFLIDDVGRGSFMNPAQRGEIWFELINHVYAKRLTLAMTSNLSAQADPSKKEESPLQKWLGNAAMERLRAIVGKQGYIPFSEEMENMRKTQAAKWQKEYEN